MLLLEKREKIREEVVGSVKEKGMVGDGECGDVGRLGGQLLANWHFFHPLRSTLLQFTDNTISRFSAVGQAYSAHWPCLGDSSRSMDAIRVSIDYPVVPVSSNSRYDTVLACPNSYQDDRESQVSRRTMSVNGVS